MKILHDKAILTDLMVVPDYEGGGYQIKAKWHKGIEITTSLRSLLPEDVQEGLLSMAVVIGEMRGKDEAKVC